MIFGQLASAVMLFAKFHAGTRKSLSEFLLPLLEQPIRFVFICATNRISGGFCPTNALKSQFLWPRNLAVQITEMFSRELHVRSVRTMDLI